MAAVRLHTRLKVVEILIRPQCQLIDGTLPKTITTVSFAIEGQAEVWRCLKCHRRPKKLPHGNVRSEQLILHLKFNFKTKLDYHFLCCEADVS